MDSRTVSIVGAIIVVGGLFAFAGDLDPPKGPIEPTMHTLAEIYAAVTQPQCCPPRPEDIRRYFVYCPANCHGGFVVIPEVEGSTGFVITDITIGLSGTFPRQVRLFEDSGEGPDQIGEWIAPEGNTTVLNFTTGLPIGSGSTLTSVVTPDSAQVWLTVSGYVY